MYIDLSIDLKEVSTIIKDFIKTYVNNSGVKGIVLGLSGGIDSAVTAILCRDSIGKKNVFCLYLPEDTTPEKDRKDIDIIIKNFDLYCEKKDISEVVKAISNNSIIKPDRFALANIKARARMILLFEYANMKSNLVCGTSNKSEMLVGYFTKYGDGGVDIMPLGDIYKTQVWELAKYLKIPKNVISKSPSGGLWHGQTDEGELKISYNQLDRILSGLEKKIDIDEISGIVGVKKSEVLRIKKMRIKNQHKSRAPLIPKVGIRTPGYDWRSPIIEG
ncbi:MAG: NAD+ synthase [Thermoplasmatales archaeon]|nr:MAG: NAD+ synthase [Thermoplasmatales archaeon]